MDWSELIARKKITTDPFAENALAGLKASGIETIYGTAVFTADGKVEVAGKSYTAGKYIIATGTSPRQMDIEGGTLLKSSDDFLLLESLPHDIVFLGTGSVTLELAQIAHAAGSHVTVLAKSELTILHFNQELAHDYLARLAADGIIFKEQVEIEKVEHTADGKLKLSNHAGFEIVTDYAVAGVGRVANVDKLNLEAVGVEADARGIKVNSLLQTKNPNIYAMGDVLAKPLAHLTPVSMFESNYLAHSLNTKNANSIEYPTIPLVIYGASKFAEVGQLSGDGISVKTLDMTNWFTYKRIAAPFSKAKIATNEKGEIVGASMISTVADELVNLLMLLIQTKTNAAGFQKMVTAYPTVASDLTYLY